LASHAPSRAQTDWTGSRKNQRKKKDADDNMLLLAPVLRPARSSSAVPDAT
jgi:hypothetical protein